jgi:hypothetical protein
MIAPVANRQDGSAVSDSDYQTTTIPPPGVTACPLCHRCRRLVLLLVQGSGGQGRKLVVRGATVLLWDMALAGWGRGRAGEDVRGVGVASLDGVFPILELCREVAILELPAGLLCWRFRLCLPMCRTDSLYS